MSNEWCVVALTVAAAVAFAASSSLKHASASQVPNAQTLHPRLIGRFVAATLSHRFWLAGLGCDVLGIALQTTALHFGELAMVQPLLVVSLVFAFVFRHLIGDHHFTTGQILWALTLCASLGGFMVLAGGGGHGAPADRLPAIIAGAIGLVFTVGFVELGRRQRGRGRAAALLGVGVGIIYAATAALLKAVTDVATHGVFATVAAWQLYVLIALGAAGMLLNQVAFQAGPITASLPATATVDPLLSVVVGVVVYDEHLHSGPGHGALLAVLLLTLGVAVTQITRLDDERNECSTAAADEQAGSATASRVA